MNIVKKLRSLRSREHVCTVEIIAALVHCQRERSYLDFGCSSIFDFLVQELKYSNAAASRQTLAPDSRTELSPRTATDSTMQNGRPVSGPPASAV